MKKLLIAVAALVALASPAIAGDNLCQGTISTDAEWVHVTLDDDMQSTPKTPPCRVQLNSDLGRRVLAKCTIGDFCDINLPVEGSDRVKAEPVNGVRTIVKIVKVCGRSCDRR